MKKFLVKNKFKLLTVLVSLCLLFCNTTIVYADELLYLGGMAMGFSVDTIGVTVLGVCDVVTNDGIISPCKNVDIRSGDIILSIDGKHTENSGDMQDIMSNISNKNVIINILRGEENLIKEVTPVKDLTNNYKLGLYLKDGLSGIGTMTFIKDDNTFMALGHPIGDGELAKISGGSLINCNIFGVVKGERGRAGELKGIFLAEKPVGTITQNLNVGLKGKINDTFDKSNLKQVSVGEGKMGKASIFSTLDGGTAKEYQIEIVKVNNNQKENKNFVIKITDKELLSLSNGIVQGMSGSPIVQDNKIIGAVTHVFLNDPTRGYGVSIQNMLEG